MNKALKYIARLQSLSRNRGILLLKHQMLRTAHAPLISNENHPQSSLYIFLFAFLISIFLQSDEI